MLRAVVCHRPQHSLDLYPHDRVHLKVEVPISVDVSAFPKHHTHAAPGYALAGLMFTIHLTPNWSLTAPKMSPHGACMSGWTMVPPCDSFSK